MLVRGKVCEVAGDMDEAEAHFRVAAQCTPWGGGAKAAAAIHLTGAAW